MRHVNVSPKRKITECNIVTRVYMTRKIEDRSLGVTSFINLYTPYLPEFFVLLLERLIHTPSECLG